jgi:uracil-DNA glycosylase
VVSHPASILGAGEQQSQRRVPTKTIEVHVSDDVQDRTDAIAAAAEEVVRHLAWLEAAGVGEVPVPPRLEHAAPPAHARADEPSVRASAVAAARPTPTPGAAPTPTGVHPTAPEKGCGSDALAQVRAELGACTRCKLAGGRTNLVFGVGASAAELVFVGEGPGEDEDLTGEPFVGKAGQLLTKMIEAMGFRREDVYIANVVKCRPPGNRNPEPDEIAACEPFLRAQLAAIRPKVIVALGKFAAHTLLRETTPISKLRGRWSEYAGVRLMPTFHPAYLLRSPEEKKKAWEDLKLVMVALGRAAPGR